MSVLGIAITASKNPILRGVVLSDLDCNPPKFEVLEHLADPQQPEEQQLADLGRAIRSHLTNRTFDAIVVRDRDYLPKARPKIADIRKRGLFDGVVVADCRARCSNTHHLTGKAIGKALRLNKAAADARASEAFGPESAEPGAAALAAWALRTS
jgi:hypothetical protein